jgi:NAD(P)-dependent dehydrogenase (short-subunit alcohol dehydrogenase family)
MKSIEKFHKQFDKQFGKLDILINNAAIISKVEKKATTVQGYEIGFGTNHLGHFLLTQVCFLIILMTQFMIPYLIQSKGKIVTVSSSGHKFVKQDKSTFDFTTLTHNPIEGKGMKGAFDQYGFTKLCGIYHSRQLHQLYFDKFGISSNSLNPGFVEATNDYDPLELGFLNKLMLPIMWIFAKDLYNGAQTSIYVATKTDKSGEYFQDNKIEEISDLAKSEKISKDLWDWSHKECLKHSEYYQSFIEKNQL